MPVTKASVAKMADCIRRLREFIQGKQFLLQSVVISLRKGRESGGKIEIRQYKKLAKDHRIKFANDISLDLSAKIS